MVCGGGLFILMLWLSAFFDTGIRWLHFFQSWLYLAAIVLSLRRSRWGYFIGIATAGFWDYLNLFVTTFLRNGLHWLAVSVGSGRVSHIDQIIAVPAWTGNLLVVIGGIWGYCRLRKQPADGLRFVLAFAGTMAFMALDIALFQPRYMGLFHSMLHPHRPW
jgi:hypothetical protein